MKQLINKAIIFFCCAIGLFFIAHQTLFFKQSFLESWASYATYPVLQVSNLFSSYICACSNFFQSHATLRTRCQKLEETCDALRNQLCQEQASQHFIEQSKELTSFLQRYELEDKIFAKILLQHFDDDEHYVYINQGSRDGVTKDMVALYKFQILGRVADVYPWYSKIVLITDRHSKIAAYANSTNADGIVKGLNNIEECELIYVSHLLTISDEDLVISSGKGLIFPEGFCLGQISRYTLKEQALYHTIYIRPLVDFKQVKFCWLADQSKINLF